MSLLTLTVTFSFCTLTRLKTDYQTSLNASCACGPSGLSLGEKKSEIISCTCWKSGTQFLSPTFTGVWLERQGETEKFGVQSKRQMMAKNGEGMMC